MNKIGLLFFLAAIVFFPACDNEIDLTAEWKDIPIVYGLLDVQDTAHYIRVEKAFLSEETSAIEIAQRPDSLYYEEGEIEVYLVDLQQNKPYALQRVDGIEEGYVRDTGIFAHAPNYLYKIRDEQINLRSGRTYRFELHRSDDQEVVTSEATVLDTLEMQFLGDRLSFKPDRFTRIRWESNENAAFYTLSLVINYEEKSPETGGEFVDKQLIWQILDRNENNMVEFDGGQFFSFLSNALEADPMITRSFESIDLELDAGGEGLNDYIRIALANTGVTGSLEVPNFSNLSEGYGVFSSITRKRVYGLGISSETRDTLRNGSMTADLNF